jgi:hypothetical protein
MMTSICGSVRRRVLGGEGGRRKEGRKKSAIDEVGRERRKGWAYIDDATRRRISRPGEGEEKVGWWWTWMEGKKRACGGLGQGARRNQGDY